MKQDVHITEKKLLTYDRIYLDSDAYQKLMDWHKEVGDEMESLDIPFEEGVLVIPLYAEEDESHPATGDKKGELWIYFAFNAHTDFMSVTAFTHSKSTDFFNPLIKCDFDMKKYPDEASIAAVSLLSRRVTESDLEQNARMLFSIVPRALNFISHYKGEIKQTEHQLCKYKKGKAKKGKPGKKRIVKIGVTVYSFPSSDSGERRQYERQTESWRVRGHWRYYKKTGNRVWIAPHTRGEGQLEAKEYHFE